MIQLVISLMGVKVIQLVICFNGGKSDSVSNLI